MQLPAKRWFKLAARHRLNQLNMSMGTISRAEIFYALIFQNAANRLGLTLPAMYPVRGAANFSLLYVLLRIVTELPIDSVLELGVGQSTLLLNALSAQEPGRLRILSIDSDRQWAGRIQGRVKHEVRHVALADDVQRGERYVAGVDEKFSLVLVDGPLGKKRDSRSSSLDILRNCLGDEYLVVFDDAERPGERDTIKKFLIEQGDRVAGVSFVHGSSSQALVYTKSFIPSGYF